MTDQHPKILLKQLGLTEYEAKACLALIRFGRCDAEKVSSISNVPLPRVYDTMSNLAKKGLVSISRTRPQLFSIINLNKFFDILKDDERRKTEDKIGNIDRISSQFMKAVSTLPIAKVESDEDDVMLTFIRRRMNIGDVWNQFQSKTKKEFLVFAGDLSWIELRAKDIKKLTKKGIKYKIIWFKCIKDVLPNVRKAMKAGVELRCYDDYSNELRCIIADGKKVYLIQKSPKPGVVVKMRDGVRWGEDIANYTGVMLTSRLIAKVFRDYFYLLWKNSMPAEKFLQMFKTKKR